MQNEPQSGGENEYFGNENNAFFGESAKTYFTPRWKAQKERDSNHHNDHSKDIIDYLLETDVVISRKQIHGIRQYRVRNPAQCI